MDSNDKIIQDWVKDGTPTSEPVTVETPAPAAPESVSADPPVAGEQPRNPDGTFAPKAASEAPQGATDPSPPAQNATPPAPGASAAAVQEYIEAQLNGQPFQLPKGVHIPLKRGNEVVFEPLETVRAERMMKRDYELKSNEAARIRQEADRAMANARAEQARVEARAAHLADQERLYREAMKDPEKMQQYEQHVQAYQSNPVYRRMVDDALLKREADAELAVRQQAEEAQIIQNGAQLAAGWIQDMATRYPDVDQALVRSEYARALQLGSATLDPSEVERIYQAERTRKEQHTAPLSAQMQALEAQIAELKAAKAAETHNANTTHALARGKAPVLAPVGGAPPAPGPRKVIERFGTNDWARVNSEWSKSG